MKEITIVLIGHKDHGKSTLIGRLLLDSSSLRQDRIKEVRGVDRISGQRFELAHLVDSFREEREREMTMDTTHAILKCKKRIYRLIDVPGHQELISQMLTGASQATIALLVVSAKEGIAEQTLQHLEIAHVLGIKLLGVVINKMDTVGYQKSIFEKLVKDFKKNLQNLGYSFKDTRFFPVSALKGDNVITKSSRTTWYSGPTLISLLQDGIKPQRSLGNFPLRFLVQDKYLKRDGEILVGRVESGKLKVGQDILFLTENKRDKIETIEDFENHLNEACAGKNIGITLNHNSSVGRGSVGVSLEELPQVSNYLSGEIFWIKIPSQRELICECGTASVKGRLQNVKSVKAGEKSTYKIYLKKQIAFDPLSRTILGKIIIKDKGRIIGVGNVR